MMVTFQLEVMVILHSIKMLNVFYFLLKKIKIGIVLKFLVNINNIIDTNTITYNNSISTTLTLEVP